MILQNPSASAPTPPDEVTIGTTAIVGGTEGCILFQFEGDVVSQDVDLSFSGDTLTTTKLAITTAITGRVNIHETGASLYIYDDDGSTLRTWFNAGTANAAAFIGSDGAQYIGNYGGYATGVILGSTNGVYFTTDNTYYGTKDLGIERSSANVGKVTDGSTGYGSLQDLYRRFGSGTPEGAVTAPVGAVFHRTDGGAGTSFYVKESGAGNTGWVAK